MSMGPIVSCWDCRGVMQGNAVLDRAADRDARWCTNEGCNQFMVAWAVGLDRVPESAASQEPSERPGPRPVPLRPVWSQICEAISKTPEYQVWEASSGKSCLENPAYQTEEDRKNRKGNEEIERMRVAAAFPRCVECGDPLSYVGSSNHFGRSLTCVNPECERRLKGAFSGVDLKTEIDRVVDAGAGVNPADRLTEQRGQAVYADPWAHRSSGIRCSTCMWFVEKKPSENAQRIIGRCRRHAPTLHGYPVVFPADWCGDHVVSDD